MHVLRLRALLQRDQALRKWGQPLPPRRAAAVVAEGDAAYRDFDGLPRQDNELDGALPGVLRRHRHGDACVTVYFVGLYVLITQCFCTFFLSA